MVVSLPNPKPTLDTLLVRSFLNYRMETDKGLDGDSNILGHLVNKHKRLITSLRNKMVSLKHVVT